MKRGQENCENFIEEKPTDSHHHTQAKKLKSSLISNDNSILLSSIPSELIDISTGEISTGFDNRKEYSDQDRHEGSFPLDEVKAMDVYSRRIIQPNSTKRKYALAVAYCGSNYSGLQVNPGAITIEAILERALFFAGAIKECNYGYLQKSSWTRAARTDKGVHAVGQCCSMKLEIPDTNHDLFLQQLNSFLPSDIQVLGITRTTKSFNARTHCTHRRYEYLIPSYLLMPEELINDLFRAHTSNPDRYSRLVGFRITDDLLQRFRSVMKLHEGTHYFHNFTSEKGKTSTESDEQLKKGKGDPTMMRYMMNIDVQPCNVSGEGNNSSDVEWLKITILGQSFLLNQIRKMIGLAVEMTRSSRSMEQITNIFTACYQPERKVAGIPMVPGLGLYLDELFFEKYNLKLKYDEEKRERSNAKKQKQADQDTSTAADDDKEDTSISPVGRLEWSGDPEIAQRFQEFKHNILYPHIAQQEKSTFEFISYLDYLLTSPRQYNSLEK